jgi:hypothetical protein
LTKEEQNLLTSLLEEKGTKNASHPAPLKIDFRKLTAGYICSANGNEGACTRFQIGPDGHCSFHGLNNSCQNYGLV